MAQNWSFRDPPNVAVFASRKIVFHGEWIYYVCHHSEDGAWEFHPISGPAAENDVAVVGLKTMVELDPSIAQLADLPCGWCAWREDEQAPWQRMRITPSD